jgi:hypothetical protein
MPTDVSEEYIASIFRVGKSTGQEIRQHVPPKHLWTSAMLHAVKAKNMVPFKVTVALTSGLPQNRCKLKSPTCPGKLGDFAYPPYSRPECVR